MTGNDRTKWGTYWRDSESSLDYGVNRYYDNVTGRFMTADPYGGSASAGNPQSWNKYSYALNDPAGGTDPWGLCTVVGAGINMSPADPLGAFSGLQSALGAIAAYPYAGLTPVGAFGSVIEQRQGPNSSTLVELSALVDALDQNVGAIDVVVYSGGAQAFVTAFGMLSASEQSRIGSILYISPGTALSSLVVTKNPDNTSVVLGSDWNDKKARIGTLIPQGVDVTNTQCDHTNLGCLLKAATGQLAHDILDGECPSSDVFYLSPSGGGGGGQSVRRLLYDPAGSVDGGGVRWFPLPGVPEALAAPPAFPLGGVPRVGYAFGLGWLHA